MHLLWRRFWRPQPLTQPWLFNSFNSSPFSLLFAKAKQNSEEDSPSWERLDEPLRLRPEIHGVLSYKAKVNKVPAFFGDRRERGVEESTRSQTKRSCNDDDGHCNHFYEVLPGNDS